MFLFMGVAGVDFLNIAFSVGRGRAVRSQLEAPSFSSKGHLCLCAGCDLGINGALGTHFNGLSLLPPVT